MSIFLGSKLRRKLLTYSFTHPDSDYYVRELADIINEDAGNLSRELRRLQNEGLYSFILRGRIKFYQLNKTHPFYDELKGIVTKINGNNGGK